MKHYDLTVTLRSFLDDNVQTKKCKVILSDKDDVKEFAEMLYGCWNYISEVKYEECEEIHVSKTYLAEEAYKMVRFE